MNKLAAINPLYLFILGAAVMIFASIVFTGVQKAVKLVGDVKEAREHRCVGRRCDVR